MYLKRTLFLLKDTLKSDKHTFFMITGFLTNTLKKLKNTLEKKIKTKCIKKSEKILGKIFFDFFACIFQLNSLKECRNKSIGFDYIS
jgi:hypothetical protein